MILFALIIFPVWGFPLFVSPYPIARGEHYIDPSLLIPTAIRYIGDHPRYATCTGVSWLLQDDVLVTTNWLGNSLQFFRFDKKNDLRPIQYLDNENGLSISTPENIITDANTQTLLIPNFKDSKITIYSIDLANHTIVPNPLFVLTDDKMKRPHGVRFSPDSQYLICVTVDHPGKILVYQMHKQHPVQFTLAQCIDSPMGDLKPKALDFSPDGRFIVIAYAQNANRAMISAKGFLASYRFDTISNDLKLVSITPDNGGSEDVRFYKDGISVFCIEQGNHIVSMYKMNPETGVLGIRNIMLMNPESELSSPHGLAFSSDYKYLAVTNCGESKVLIYSVEDIP